MMWCFLLLAAGVGAQLLHNRDNCNNRCFTNNDYSHSCQCNYDCETHSNCCPDFLTRCRGSELGLVVTQKEINTFAQSIWDNDVNRIENSFYKLNYQQQTKGKDHGDLSANMFIAPTDSRLNSTLTNPNTTYPAFIHLLDNYAANVHHVEHRPDHEIAEENHFWNAISKTQVMKLTFQFLVNNGFIKGDMNALRTVFNELWFELYPKQHSSHKSDSGFEHVMTGVITHHGGNHQHNATSTVTGMHNWVKFYLEEQAGKLNYDGIIKYVLDPALVDVRFDWHNAHSHGVTFFVGTSPEFDMSLYTVCALAFPNKPCSFVINGQHVTVQTTTAAHRQVKEITSAVVKFHAAVTTPSTT